MIAVGERPRDTRIAHKRRELLHRRGVVERQRHDSHGEAHIARHHHQIRVCVFYFFIAGFEGFDVVGVGIQAAADVDIRQMQYLEILCR